MRKDVLVKMQVYVDGKEVVNYMSKSYLLLKIFVDKQLPKDIEEELLRATPTNQTLGEKVN